MRAVAVLLLALGLSACAGIRTTDLSEIKDVPRATEVTGVPFYPQKDYYCGPASLAMALSWSGEEMTQDDIAPELITPDRKGTFRHDMISAARRHGRIAMPVMGLENILKENAAGHPVIVFQNLGLSWWSKWHFAVLIGYDLGRDYVILHSGEDEHLQQDIGLFERTWARGDRWAITVLPPDQLPATATLWPALEAAAGLERVGRKDAAHIAYTTILKRWPDAWAAHFALGNLAHSGGSFKEAEAAYRNALAIDDGLSDVWNNLAHALKEQGKTREAIAAAQKAIAIGGPNLEAYRDTLATLKTSMP